MRDFNLTIYRQLLETLLNKGYEFVTYADYVKSVIAESRVHSAERKPNSVEHQTLNSKPYPLCILRHDVDRQPENSLATAKIEKELGIKGTYYFRSVPESFDESIIRQIAMLGHEIGYHYEEIDFAWRQINGQWSMLNGQHKKNKNTTFEQSGNDAILDLAYSLFKVNLEKLRNLVPVTTICMHGSPLSPLDNRLLWDKYNYKELGIIGEPYFDINWNVFGYLTDTGRRWDGYEVSVRDKVHNVKNSMFNVQLKSTSDIIVNADSLPDRLMINVHPQRWNDKLIPWVNQLVSQNIKNVIKRFIVEE